MTTNAPTTDAAEQPSPLKRALIAIDRLQTKLADVEQRRHEPIAVVGLGVRVPGAGDPAAFWRMLRDGVDAIGEVPADRWDIDEYYDPDPDAIGKMSTRRGAFLDDVRSFDPQFFGIAPREAVSMDPQQRILLEVTWEALEHAAIAAGSLAHTRTGVFIGMTTSDYAHVQLAAAGVDGLDAYYASGVAHSVASGRLSYILGLEGPSLTVDTACSSSLVAVHLAVQSLRAGECTTAIAGGVNLMLSPENSITFSKYHMLAPDGRCKTFDASADGFARGEGCGVVVLKRLRDAIDAGDPIQAVIRGSAVNQDGQSSGLTAPNGPSQEAVIRDALADAQLDPAAVGYVEAHGTGTALGDPIEVQALAAALGRDRAADHPLAIGSVKTNVGHLEAVAGVAGLIKAILVVQHGEIPPHLNLDVPSPHIDWDAMPIVVPTECTPLPADRQVAGVSSFGFSGTNAHVIVAAHEPTAPVDRPTSTTSTHLLPLSGRSVAALRAQAERYAASIAADPDRPIGDVCTTAGSGRDHHAHRVVVAADTAEQMSARLVDFAAGRASVEGVTTGEVTRADPAKTAFLFTGQGSQYTGMARGLYATEPVFRDALDRVAAAIDSITGQSLLDVVFGSPDDAGATAALAATGWTQPALFAIEWSLVELWRSWGVEPQVLLGHSVGEYVAAVVAGVLSLDDGVRLIVARGALMQALPAGGGMAAIFAGVDDVTSAIEQAGGVVAVAAVNGPAHTVVSGDLEAVRAVAAAFAERGTRVQELDVSHAFHSPRMEPMLAEFERVAASVAYRRPTRRVISNVTGAPIGDEIADPGYWVRHVLAPVEFERGVGALQRLGVDVVVEIGPHPVLSTMAQGCVTSPGTTWAASLRRDRDDVVHIREALATLYVAGVDVDWSGVDVGRRTSGMPTYPFERQEYWVPVRRRHRRGAVTEHPLLGSRIRSVLRDVQYEQILGVDSIDFVRDHRVAGTSIMPGTGFIEMAVAAAGRLGDVARLTSMELLTPLVVPMDDERIVQTVVSPVADGGVTFEVHSQVDGDDRWQLHARGRAAFHGERPPADIVRIGDIAARCAETIAADDHYDRLAARGLAFGPSLRGVVTIARGDGEALATVALAADPGPYVLHPAALDACLQTMVWLAPDGDDVYLPFAIDAIEVMGPLPERVVAHTRLDTGDDRLIGEVDVYDETGRHLVAVRGVRFVATSAAALRNMGRVDLGDWFYDLEWRPAPERAHAGPPLEPAALVAGAADRLAELAERYELGRQQELQDALRAVSGRYLARALAELGADFTPGASFALTDLAVADQHHRLVARLLAGLADDGVVREDVGRWHVIAAPALDDPADEVARLVAEHPDGFGELTITARCGAGLAGALSGSTDPLELLFPGGSSADAERMYRDSPFARFYNSIVADVVARAVEQRRGHRRARILEIGAGTGGTTDRILRTAAPDGFDYTFTDISPLFVERARERFGDLASIDFRTLDIETDPIEQGCAAHGYDVVVAANVLHATTDLRATFGRVARLLAPGGVLVLLEMTRPERYIDISFGLTPGWWSFDDDLRSDYVLMGRDRWGAVLEELGFTPSAVSPPLDLTPDADLTLQTVIVAQAPTVSPSSRDWLVLADLDRTNHDGVGGRLAALAREAGDRVTVARRAPDGVLRRDGDTWWIDPTDAEQIATLVASSPDGWDEVVHAWCLDADESPIAGQRPRVGSALALAQALLATGAHPRLTLVTSGAQGLPGEAPDPAQATLWGLGRSIVLEHPELRCTCIDLDPAPADDGAAALWAELDGDSDDQVLRRRGARHVPRLRRRADLVRPAADVAPQRIALSGDGVFDHMTLVPAPRIAPGSGQVEIAVHAAALNFRDVMNALSMRDDAEAIGSECAGVITAIGVGVDDLTVGDAVIAVAPGCFGDFVLADARLVVPKPTSLTFAEAAALPLAYLTAHDALHRQAKVVAGESVLVHAAAGGVGLATIELARRAGADVVATAGSDHKRRYLRELGITDVGDSRSVAFTDVVRARGGGGVDVVINSLTGELLTTSFEVLAPGGRFVELGKQEVLTDCEARDLRDGVTYHTVPLAEDLLDRPADVAPTLRELVHAVGSGELRTLPVQQFPLADASAAFRYMAQARHIGKIVIVPDGAGDTPTPPTPVGAPGATYLVTGGLSGLGLLAAEWLVEQGVEAIALVGRRAPGEPALAAIERMERAGAKVLVCRADVSQRDDVAGVLQQISAELPLLRGVIHSAGVLDDGAMVRQEWPRFETVFGPKVDGTWHLHELTRDHDLDHFVLFSSIASLFGSAGQSNHSAANRFMDALAAARRARGLPGLSINWGAWSDVGAAAATEDRSDRQGVDPMTPSLALDALLSTMTRGPANVAVTAMDWPAYFGRSDGAPIPAWLADLAVDVAESGPAPTTQSGMILDPADLLAAAPDTRRRMLLDFVAERVAHVLGSSSGAVSEHQPLNEMGLDSLMAVELRNALGAGLGLAGPLPAVVVFDYPTVDALAGYLDGVVTGAADDEVAPAGPAEASSVDDILAALEEIDDAELDRLLGGSAESEQSG